MSRASIVWMEDSLLKSAPLADSQDSVIGRGQDAAVVLSRPTVSRHHARVRTRNGRFLIEQLSPSNPTHVNSQPLEAPTTLTDKAVIELGGVRLVFHDLEAADQSVVRQRCGFCGRENPGSRKECWYCGTVIANAPTVSVQRLLSRVRLVSSAGETLDLFDGETGAVQPGGALSKNPEAGAGAVVTVQVEHNQPLIGRTAGAPVRVNGAPAGEGQPLKHGDLLSTGGQTYVLLVR